MIILREDENLPDGSESDDALLTGVVVTVVHAAENGPEPVHGNRHQCEHGRERHTVVEEDPETAEELSERPAAQQRVDGVK